MISLYRADSFNGWTGHVLAAFSLLYLAQLTQRIAILQVGPFAPTQSHTYSDARITLPSHTKHRLGFCPPAGPASETSSTMATR